MRCIWATLLVAVFSFTLIEPGVFATNGEQKLPACCRKNGNHHCAMTPQQEIPSGASLQAGRCPWFNLQQTIPPVQTLGTLKPAQAIFAAVVSHPTLRPQVEALRRVAFDRSSQKRGPPAA
jgi:hypothetical protein